MSKQLENNQKTIDRISSGLLRLERTGRIYKLWRSSELICTGKSLSAIGETLRKTDEYQQWLNRVSN